MKRKKKHKIPKERNFLVPMMRLHCKDGPHLDKKKEASRRACRVRLRPGVDGLPVFLLCAWPGITPPAFGVRDQED